MMVRLDLPAASHRALDVQDAVPPCSCHQTDRTMTRQDGQPGLIEHCAVLAAVKTASRRLRRWPAASLDRRSARRIWRMQAEAKKRLSNRTKKHTVKLIRWNQK